MFYLQVVLHKMLSLQEETLISAKFLIFLLIEKVL